MMFDANVTNSTAMTLGVTSEVLPETVGALEEVVQQGHHKTRREQLQHNNTGSDKSQLCSRVLMPIIVPSTIFLFWAESAFA